MGYGEVFQFTIHYLPFTNEKGERRSPFSHLAEWTGLEPATSAVTGQHSNQLNYHSYYIKPAACGGSAWWVLTGSNRRHSPCKGDALPTELSTRNLRKLCFGFSTNQSFP